MKILKEDNGEVCPKCGCISTKFYVISKRQRLKCKKCASSFFKPDNYENNFVLNVPNIKKELLKTDIIEHPLRNVLIGNPCYGCKTCTNDPTAANNCEKLIQYVRML